MWLRGLAIGLAFFSSPAQAVLTIDVLQSLAQAIPVNVAAFDGEMASVKVTDIVRADMDHSGVFRSADAAVNASYVVRGKLMPQRDGQYVVEFYLDDVANDQRLLAQRVTTSASRWRDVGHYISDRVYERITGQRGHFSTKLAYVSRYTRAGKKRFKLMMSDYDGQRPAVLLDSREPLLSPTWSPDGRQIAYVSFEAGRPAIFIQHLTTRKRTKLASFPGMNNSPAWSPDGRQMAMSLSRDGNSEIYLMNIASGALKRLTQHPAIDTEPRWSSDGQSLVFTSDRGGSAQIYRIDVATGVTKRLTSAGRFNARADLSQSGRHLALISDSGDGRYRLAVQDMDSGVLSHLTNNSLDASPTFAPNGNMLAFVMSSGGQGRLALSAANGGFIARLAAADGDIREPAWSPWIK